MDSVASLRQCHPMMEAMPTDISGVRELAPAFQNGGKLPPSSASPTLPFHSEAPPRFLFAATGNWAIMTP